MRSQTKGKHRDLVEELIGEEAENDYTHKPDGSYEILNDIVVDRGPNPSQWSHNSRRRRSLTRYQQCPPSKCSETMSILYVHILDLLCAFPLENMIGRTRSEGNKPFLYLIQHSECGLVAYKELC